MHSTKYNQSKAAIKMGWSRGTLRGKLKEHFGNEYFRDSDNG
jgi:DNA-binding protein Fis